jgi:O-antigen/teichoic acid export membrane protein
VKLWRPKDKDYTVVGPALQLVWCLVTLPLLGWWFTSFMGWVGVIVGTLVSSASGVFIFYLYIKSDKRKYQGNGVWS